MGAATNASIARECTVGPKSAGSEYDRKTAWSQCSHGGLWKYGVVEIWHDHISAPVLQRKRFFQMARDLGRRVHVRDIPYTVQ